MASLKVMASTSPTNQDMPRQTPLSSLLADLQQQTNTNTSINSNDHSLSHHQTLTPSMSMDDLLKSIYPDGGGASISREGSFSLPKEIGNNKSLVDEAWNELVTGGGGGGGATAAGEEMTLEDFLTKAGAVREEDVNLINSSTNTNNVNISSNANNENVVINSRSDRVGLGVGSYSVGTYNPAAQVGVAMGVIGNGSTSNNNGGSDGRGILAVGPPAGGGRVGRAKRRAVEEPPVDKATLQKQRRMIKNRESAARSRNRKQAQTVELESLVTQLEQENARLLREEAEEHKKRFKQLMQNIIPIDEKQKIPRTLRRVNSTQCEEKMRNLKE